MTSICSVCIYIVYIAVTSESVSKTFPLLQKVLLDSAAVDATKKTVKRSRGGQTGLPPVFVCIA